MIYADTNFYTNILVDLSDSQEARRLLPTAHDILPITRLLRLEIANALQQCLYMARHGAQVLRITPEYVSAVRAQFADEVRTGRRFQNCPLDDDTVEQVFMQLSDRHTAKEGFRTYDILHVSSALVLGCDTFWSFDAKAKKLARLEGLKVN
ncbi:MAG: type II toxin-antitoxin system VapC family toxin [Verrucomicrobiaceae bacterium]|nr:type II toxin-antitoxin system VapC family toxin [Verrucomicrobiaceae bacterium]